MAFINIVPIQVAGIAKRVRCASFSEWLRNIINIHYLLGFKIKVIVITELVPNSVTKTFRENVFWIAMMNQAHVTRMNIYKTDDTKPISENIKDMDSKINQITETETDTMPNEVYHWKVLGGCRGRESVLD